MDIYSGRYYIINKTLLAMFGLWPYDNCKKKLIQRIFVSIIMAMIILPQIIRIYLNFGVDLDVVIEHMAILAYVAALVIDTTSIIKASKLIFTKVKCMIFNNQMNLANYNLKILYENIANNWQMIKDKHELHSLIEYSERGRILTIGYIIYMYCAVTTFCTFPLAPIILNIIKPLNASRSHIFVFGGEFFIDRDKHYQQIYIFDCACCVLTTIIMTAMDSMYASSIEHCLGLFAIIKSRLQKATKFITIKCSKNNLLYKDEAYDYIVQTVELHKKVIKFTDILESSYSLTFFVIMGLTMILLSFELVLVLIKFDQLLEFTRFTVIVFGIIINLFYVSWPGQKLITCSTGLFQDAYLNEWYDLPLKAQKLLGFLTLRCSKPCQLTAGGIYIMNFANFALIVKTSLSYMTIFASFR